MNERQLLGQWQRYHQQLADQYGRLLAALEGATEGEGGHSSPNGTASLSEPQKKGGAKYRVPTEKRVALPLRAKREAKGVSIKTLAEWLGVSPSYVGQVESGAQSARPTVVQHWEAVLNEMTRDHLEPVTAGNE